MAMGLTDKEKKVINEILKLEKFNNRVQKISDTEMANKIIELIKKEVKDEV